MFEIRDDQIDAMRASMRAAFPDSVLRDLLESGCDATRTNSSVVTTDERGFETRMHFRDDGLPDRVVMPSGFTYRFEHDERGRMSGLEPRGNALVRFTRDESDRITAVSREGIDHYDFEYDDSGRVVAIGYPDGTRKRWERDESGQVTAVVDRTGARTLHERDADGQLLAVVDPLGRATRFDSAGGTLLGVEFPDGTREDYWYDEERSTAVVTGRDGEPVVQALDEVGAISGVYSIDGSFVEYDYAADGSLASATNDSGTVGFSCDDVAGIDKERTAQGVTRVRRDADGRWTEMATPFGDTIRYEYDADGRLIGMRDWSGRASQFVWAKDGSLAEVRLPNGLVEKRRYSQHARLSHATVGIKGAKPLSEQRYRYDSCGRLVEIADDGVDNPWTKSLSYDPESRLLAVRDGDGTVVESFQHDAKGNIVRDGELDVEVGPMDDIRRHGDRELEYDALGNIAALPSPRGRLHCRFAKDGSLRETELNGTTVRYEYDALGRRTLKTDGTRTWRFGWFGQQLIWEQYQNEPSAEWVRRDYLYLPNTPEPFAFREHGRCYYLQNDARGAVIRVFRDDGVLVWSARYDAFGEAHVEVARVRQPLRLVGQYLDEETGLHHQIVRYYCPWLKTYISREPRWVEPEARNYAYCNNDPYNFVDPTGGFVFCLLAAVAAVAVGAVVGGVAAAMSGGDWRAGAVRGALSTAGAIIGFALGGPVGATVGGVIGSGLGGFAGSVTQQYLDGEPICWKCALTEGAVAAAFDLALLGLGKIPGVKSAARAIGRVLAGKAGALKAWAGPAVSRAARFLGRAAKGGAERMGKAIARNAPAVRRAAANLAARGRAAVARQAGQVKQAMEREASRIARRAPKLAAQARQGAERAAERAVAAGRQLRDGAVKLGGQMREGFETQVAPRIQAAATRARDSMKRFGESISGKAAPYRPRAQRVWDQFKQDFEGGHGHPHFHGPKMQQVEQFAAHEAGHHANREFIAKYTARKWAEHKVIALSGLPAYHGPGHHGGHGEHGEGHGEQHGEEHGGHEQAHGEEHPAEHDEHAAPHPEHPASPQASEGFAAARLTDECEHDNNVKSGSQDTVIGKQPAARLGDQVTSCVRCLSPPGKIVTGSKTVFINSVAAARVSDQVECGGADEPPPPGKHPPVTPYVVKKEDDYVGAVFRDDAFLIEEEEPDEDGTPPPPDEQPERKPMSFLDGLSLDLDPGSAIITGEQDGGNNTIAQGEQTVIVGG